MLKHNDKVMLNAMGSRLGGLLTQLVAEQVAPVQSRAEEQVALAAKTVDRYFKENLALTV